MFCTNRGALQGSVLGPLLFCGGM